MAEKLKIISLGGLNEIGKNMTAYEYGGEIIVVDCGMAFPGDDMYGIDCVIPDVSYLVKHKNRIRGMFITHGHEDHIGAIPYVLKQINTPIYCTRFTAGLIKLKKDATLLATTVDIVENPKKLSFYELEPAQLPRSLDDVAAAVINANYALQAGLNPAHDSIALEAKSSPFGNVVVVRDGDEAKPEFQKLKAAITSPEVKKFIEEKYKGGVIPVF